MAINAKVDSVVYEGIEKITTGGKTVELTEVYSGSQSIVENGTYDIGGKAQVVVNVPTESTGGSEPTGSININTNGTHDVTDYAQAVVNVPQEGYTADKIFCGNWNNDFLYKEANVQVSGERIRDYAFAGLDVCKVTAPNAVKLGAQAFKDCVSLTEIDAPNVTAWDGKEIFMNCTKMTKAHFPKITSMHFSHSYIFSGCSSLVDVNLEACTSLSEKSFENCKALQTISLPVATGGANSTASAFFKGCTSLQNVNLPVWKDGKISMFENCTSLEETSLPALTRLEANMFKGCTALKKVDFGDALTTMSATTPFGNCTSLETAILRHNGVVTINNGVFQNSTKGVTVYVPSAQLSAYQADSVWSKQTNVTFAAIEGSDYE